MMSRVRRRTAAASVAVILLGVAAHAQAPAAAPGPGAAMSDLAVPGGVTALFRAADMPGPAERSTALLVFARAVHGADPAAVARALQHLDTLTSLDALARTLPGRQVALVRSSKAPAPLVLFATTCGLLIESGSLLEDAAPDATARRRALARAGVPLADWVQRLNAGETVRVEVPADAVPLPLPPELWDRAVFDRPVGSAALARAILADTRAASLYVGLMSLDDETLAFLAGHEATLTAIAQRGAGALAQWGRSFHVRGGRLALPGGDQAAPLWEAVVGADPRGADAFATELFTRDGGRTAFFYDTVANLDADRQAFALGAGVQPGDRRGRFRALYGSFSGTRTFELVGGWPRVRHPSSPAATLMQVHAAPAGSMAEPSSMEMWEAAATGDPAACGNARTGGRPADAAWLVERVEREPLERRASLLGAVTFGQRAFARARAADLRSACEVLAAYPRHQALLLTLERMGFEAPADYLAVLRFTGRLWSGLDRRSAVLRTAQSQGVLAILDHAAATGSIPRPRARTLALSLATLSPVAAPAATGASAEARAPGAFEIGAWMARVLVPELCGADALADPCFVRIVSGDGAAARPPGTVSWEEFSYRIDLGAATAVRIRLVREQQNAPRIDDALAVGVSGAAIIAGRPAPAVIEQHVAALKALAKSLPSDRPELFWHSIPAVRAGIGSAAARLAGDPAAFGEIGSGLADAADVLLAHALASFAYALAIGDSDDAALLGGDPAPRHQFDGTVGPAVEPWNVPEVVQLVDRSWVVQGSLLALYTAYPRSWMRRLSLQDPGSQLRPDPRDLRGLGETVAVFQPFDLTDEGRDAIVAAIRRGRASVAELIRAPDRLWRRAAELGLNPARCRAALWLARTDPARAAALFALSDLMWLGEPALPRAQLDRWGAATRMADGGLSLRMPESHGWEDLRGPRGVGLLSTRYADMNLLVAEALADLKLPAVLAPAVLTYAALDVIAAAEMSYPDDWFALARAVQAVPRDRFIDYVSSLTAFGPLVPAK